MENDNYIFDEDNAVKFIRAKLPAEVSGKYDDDEILCIVDIIWDYYERKGLLELNQAETDEESLDPADLTAYVKKEVKKDKELVMDPSDIELLVKAELDYEESLEDYI